MHFSAILVAVASATGAVANLHFKAWCVSGGLADADPKNVGATKSACNAYKNRHTGDQWWDVCPDCFIETKDGNNKASQCHSHSQHIGGDEWQAYCIKFGATDGAAN
ncbi:hypothetical protein CSOJ01_08836 [Colletotrichum sojae]|uniref:Secreted protein n=1 Tax=Colletotrichum sojae TaxID=2175907 RepID=A0A8H6MSD5_9PEZI|nr:hypothetical protein CSOJ01_08836 [Colletotrichum sojae]